MRPTVQGKARGWTESAKIARRERIAQQRASGHVARGKDPDTLPGRRRGASTHDGGRRNPDAQMLMLVQYRAGLRISEAVALSAKDFQDDYLTVREGKGKKSRTVPVHPELAAALQSHVRYRGRGRLVTANYTTAWRWYNEAAEAVGLEEVGTHTLRQSAARHWSSRGCQSRL